MKGFDTDLKRFFEEDDLQGNNYYLEKLPREIVTCNLKIKSDLSLAGLPYFISAFNYLDADLSIDDFNKYEGKFFKADEVITFSLPFSIALTGERVALNLLQRASSIATFTKQFVKKADPLQIKILDTRKTTPGLRALEKYAVRIGGGYNHRFSQDDVWMIKDNHKNYFGGVKPALNFFRDMQTFYQPIIVEIHSIPELEESLKLGVKHVMLDNFSPSLIKDAVKLANKAVTIEVSGGINLANIDEYLIAGIDAISIGSLTHSAPHVDLSMKILHSGMKL